MQDDDPNSSANRLKQAVDNAGLLNDRLRFPAKTATESLAFLRSTGLQRAMQNVVPKPIHIPAPDIFGRIEEWREIHLAYTDRLRRLTSSFQTVDFKRMFSAFDWIVEEGRKAKLVEQTGWLPHDTTPFDLLEGELTEAEISDIIARHYETHWDEVERTFLDRAPQYSIDEEAKATFREGLQAHRHGLFRVAPRLLFPEIERVAANEFYAGSHKTEVVTAKGKTKKNPITRLEEVRETALELPLGDLASYEYSWHLFKKVEAHLYEEVADDMDAIASFIADPVPNRHAALHGLVCYRTRQTSLNAIIMTDFMFHLITQIKKYKNEEVGTPD